MSDCIDILRSISATCASINQIGGVDKRAWVTQLNQIESYTFDSNGYVNSLITRENGTSNYRYELAQIIGKKNTHSGNYEGVVGENVSLVKQNAILKIYTDSPSDRDKVVDLFDAQELVVFFENSNGKIEVFGLDKGLEGSALVGGTGTEMQDDTAVTITLTGDQNKLPYFFLYGGSLATSIEYLDSIGLNPIYSFSAKFSAVSSLDLTGCFLDSNNNDCATLINWGDGTIDSNLTHTYSISGDYVISVVCEDAVSINVNGKSIIEFNYALPSGLQSLDLGGNQIVDFNPSIALPSGLQSLDLSGNQIVDFNPSIALPIGLQNLYLGGNQIVDFNPSIALPIGLQNLGLGENQIVDFNPSIALPIGLQELYLDRNQIVDFNPSIALPSGLQSLDLGGNQIVDFNPSIALPIGLQELYLDRNQIVDFNPSIALPIGLQNLYLGGNQIVDFNPSIALPIGLQGLYLGDNQMTIAGYTASEVWANAQPSFTNSCNVEFINNIDSVSGTDLETILISKNCTVTV